MCFDFHDYVTRAKKYYSVEEFISGQFGKFWNEYLFKGVPLQPVLAVLVPEPIEFDYNDCNSTTGLIDNYVYSSKYIPRQASKVNVELLCFMKGYENTGLRLSDIFIIMSGGYLSDSVLLRISFGGFFEYLISSDKDNKRYHMGDLFTGEKIYEIANKYNPDEISQLNDYELERFKEILDIYPYVQKTFFGSRFLDAIMFTEVTEELSNKFKYQLSVNRLMKVLGFK